jgi:hypothetical protein
VRQEMRDLQQQVLDTLLDDPQCKDILNIFVNMGQTARLSFLLRCVNHNPIVFLSSSFLR